MAPKGPRYALCWVSQNGPLAHHLSLKVDSTKGPQGGLVPFWVILGHVWPVSLLSAPGAHGAILSSKVTTDESRRGVTRSPFDGVTQGYPPTKFGGRPDGRIQDTEIRPTGAPLLACLLLDPSPKVYVKPFC